jgi:integrase
VSKLSPDLQVAAILPKGTPTFKDLLKRLDAADLSPTKKRDFASALRCVAGAIGKPLAQAYAHEPWLRPLISAVVPANLGISPKTWSTRISALRGVIAELDRSKPRVNRRKDLTPEWKRLFETFVAADTKFVRFAVSGFVFFLSQSGVVPTDVSNEHAFAYRENLAATQLRKDPDETYRKSISGWDRAAAAHAFWPQQRLSAPSRQKKIRPDKEDLPASFVVDIELYLKSLSKPDLLSDSKYERPLRAATIKAHEDNIMLFVGAVIKSGISSTELTSLAALVAPERVKQGLNWLFAQNDGEPRQSHRNLIHTLLSVARRHAKADESDIKQLVFFEAKLTTLLPSRRGMTEKNRGRIRVFRDSEVLAKLLNLPELLFKRGMESNAPKKRLNLIRDAVMLAILRHHPIRRKNLINLRPDDHIQRTRTGAYLVIQASETKARKLIEFEMSPQLLSMIDTLIALQPGSPWLFPGAKDDKPINATYVSARVPTLLLRELGIAMNLHMARHLAAFVFLHSRPGHYEEVRRLLGHSSTSSTLDSYASFETDSVGHSFSEAIAASQGSRPVKKVTGS